MFMAILMSANNFENFADSGLYFQFTLGRKLMDIEHYHDYYEIICVISGSCTHKINGHQHWQNTGEVFILRPGDTHCFLNQAQNTSVLSVSFFRKIAEPFFCAYMLTDIEESDDAPSYKLASNELINQKRLGEHIFTLPKNDRIQLSRVLIGQFLSALTLHRSLTSKTSADLPESFAFALRGMNELKFAAEGMPAFLRLSNFSHAQLCRLTKKYLGKTPSEIITEIRMSYAWELVTCSDLDCEAVSEAVGFKSYSHFCLIFLKTYVKAPSKARHDTIDKPQTV